MSELHSPDEYPDQHFIDSDPNSARYLNEKNRTGTTNRAVPSGDLKAKTNPTSKLYLGDMACYERDGIFEVYPSENKEGVVVKFANSEAEESPRSLLKIKENKVLFDQVRSFILTKPYYLSDANDLTKRSLTYGTAPYLIEKESGALGFLVQAVSQATGSACGGNLSAFLDSKVIDRSMERLRNVLTKRFHPFFEEDNQMFLKRARDERLMPIRQSGRCVDIRTEDHTIVLYVEGDGPFRTFSNWKAWKEDPRFVKDALVTIEGIPFNDNGIPVNAATRIIRRLPILARNRPS